MQGSTVLHRSKIISLRCIRSFVGKGNEAAEGGRSRKKAAGGVMRGTLGPEPPERPARGATGAGRGGCERAVKACLTGSLPCCRSTNGRSAAAGRLAAADVIVMWWQGAATGAGNECRIRLREKIFKILQKNEQNLNSLVIDAVNPQNSH